MAAKRRLVVIGAVAAGTSAAAKAKRANPELEVLLLERGKDISYAACGLPYLIAGLVSRPEELIARTGLTEREAKAKDLAVAVSAVQAPARARYYPGNSPLHVKLIADANSGRLLGAQMIGVQGAAKRIDVLAAALYARMTVDDLARLDCSYAPPYAPVWDPILVAANVVGRCR